MLSTNRALPIALAFAGLLLAGSLSAQTHTVFFDAQPLGTTSFSENGSNWSNATVATFGLPEFYASGAQMLHVNLGTGLVTFDEPIDSVNFFYVHGDQVPQGTATAFDSGGAVLGSVTSNVATFFGDPGNFETMDFPAPIARVEFSAAVVDNFSFTIDPVPVDLQTFTVE